MQVQFINNCRLVLSLAWRIVIRFGEVLHQIPSTIANRGRFSSFVLPMAVMAALLSLLSTIVYTRDYQRAVAMLVYTFGSFLFFYILFVTLLNIVARRNWFTDNPPFFCERAKTFVVCILLVHFDVVFILSLFPDFSFATLLEVYAIYVSWTLSNAYMELSQNRNFFGLGFGVFYVLFVKYFPKVIALCFPNMPI